MKSKINKTVQLLTLIGFISVGPFAQAQTIMQQLKNNNETTQFAAALENANLDDRLNQDGPFTLFAPSNRTFNGLTTGQKSDADLLLNHIFTGMATERSLKAMSNITCLSGRNITVHEGNEKRLMVDSIVILKSNIRADNGVIHIIDGVIK